MRAYDCGAHKPCDCQKVTDNPAPSKGTLGPGDIHCLRCGEVVSFYGLSLIPAGCHLCLPKPTPPEPR